MGEPGTATSRPAGPQSRRMSSSRTRQVSSRWGERGTPPAGPKPCLRRRLHAPKARRRARRCEGPEPRDDTSRPLDTPPGFHVAYGRMSGPCALMGWGGRPTRRGTRDRDPSATSHRDAPLRAKAVDLDLREVHPGSSLSPAERRERRAGRGRIGVGDACRRVPAVEVTATESTGIPSGEFEPRPWDSPQVGRPRTRERPGSGRGRSHFAVVPRGSPGTSRRWIRCTM
jgi:hypothetical protein